MTQSLPVTNDAGDPVWTVEKLIALIDSLNRDAVAQQDGGITIWPFGLVYSGCHWNVQFLEHTLWNSDGKDFDTIEEVAGEIQFELGPMFQALNAIVSPVTP